MSVFYGTLVGSAKNPRTCQGSYKTGIRAAAQSWDGSVVVEMDYDRNGDLVVEVCCREGSESTIRGESWEGTFEEFSKLLKRSARRRRS